jgi:hypothetical protein
MLDPVGFTAPTVSMPVQEGRKVLRMVHNDRMGGSVPAWVDAGSVRDEIQENLRSASTASMQDSSQTLALNAPSENAVITQEKPFGFADLLDMINPLQHIPLVNHLYRGLTGDEIRPASMVIGGAVFGGPIGAASGLVNVIVREETGKDIGDNMLGFAMNGELPQYKTTKQQSAYAYSTQGNALQDLPGALLAFADLSHPEIIIEKTDDVPLHLKESY